MQKIIDLHTHSTASDGTDSPEMLITKAKNIGLSAIALTDHNNFDGVERAQSIADELDIELIHGIEISAKHNNSEIHILGYWIDSKPNIKAFEPLISHYKNILDAKNEKLMHAFNKLNMPINYNDLYKILQRADKDYKPNEEKSLESYKGVSIRKPFVIHTLLEKGYVQDIEMGKELYQRTLDALNIDEEYIEPKEIIELLRENNAFVSLAHPYRYFSRKENNRDKQLYNLIEKLKFYGLQGLECYHSSNSIEETEKSLAFAREFNLIATGGSDYHAKVKPNVALGEASNGFKIPYSILENIRNFT